MTLPRAEPLFFGPEHRPLFGWLHRPEKSACSSMGIVICNPFGYEAVCAHRSLRHFAEHAAAAGFPTLRFDYDGTGDSAGDDFDSGRAQAWVDSISCAADFLRDATPIQEVCLAGLRLGAPLAAVAAARRSDVAAMILWAPVPSTKAYLRELRALQLAMKQEPPVEMPAGDNGIQESAGFLLTRETRDELAQLDLSSCTRAPAAQVLILDRNDLAPSTKLQNVLNQRGAAVEHGSFSGYVEMMLDSHEALVPAEMISKSIEWLCRLPRRTATAKPVNTAQTDGHNDRSTAQFEVTAATGERELITERAVFLDTDLVQFGLISEPARNKPSGKAIVLVNSGAVHRIGPNRLYVALARRWAASGHIVLRLDLPGIGDSLPRPGEPENVVYSRTAINDVGLALQYLRSHYTVDECYSMGLCSGAYHSLKAALTTTLKGVVVINPLTFFWKEGMSLEYADFRVANDAMRYRRTAFQFSSWLKLVQGRVDLGELTRVLAMRASSILASRWRNITAATGLPAKDDLGQELHNIASRGTQINFVFAASDPGQELLRLQGGAAAKRLIARGNIEIAILEDANHTFTGGASRQQLTAVLSAALAKSTSAAR